MSADFTTWDRATLEQFAREATDKLVDYDKAIDAAEKVVAAMDAEIERNRAAIDELVAALRNCLAER